jgi:hypothetical protein
VARAALGCRYSASFTAINRLLRRRVTLRFLRRPARGQVSLVAHST